jgi:hypothetical protein
LNNLGAWLNDNGKNKDAEPLFRESLNIMRKTLSEDHWELASTKSRLGGCLTGLKQFEEAEPLLVESYPILKSKRGEKNKHTQKALSYIIDLYKAWGKPEKAAEYRAMLPKVAAK